MTSPLLPYIISRNGCVTIWFWHLYWDSASFHLPGRNASLPLFSSVLICIPFDDVCFGVVMSEGWGPGMGGRDKGWDGRVCCAPSSQLWNSPGRGGFSRRRHAPNGRNDIVWSIAKCWCAMVLRADSADHCRYWWHREIETKEATTEINRWKRKVAENNLQGNLLNM